MAFLSVPFTVPSDSQLQALIARLPPVPAPRVDVSNDLTDERSRTRLDGAQQLTALMYHGDALLELKRRLTRYLERHDVLKNSHLQYYMKKEELYARCCAVLKVGRETQLELGVPEELVTWFWDVVGESVPVFLHYGMFIPTIEKVGTPEQQQRWLPRCHSWEMLGSYAQTELAHGSNVRGLQTTATYIRESDEFDIHTPSLLALKWWPDGKQYGVYPFMVQLRDVKTHEPLPGISLKDLGPKIGFNTMDNGVLQLNHVRIPRNDMLMGAIEVSRDGKVKRLSEDSQIKVYSTMLQMRSGIVQGAFSALGRAVTIATRYAIMYATVPVAIMLLTHGRAHTSRRQFFDPDDRHSEMQIIDYQSQRNRLFVPLAASYAFFFLGRMMQDTVDKHIDSQRSLARAHASSSGLKVLTTTLCSAMIEDLRKGAHSPFIAGMMTTRTVELNFLVISTACGGHGYSRASGLPDLFATYVQMNTVEGENGILTQQVARYILKQYQAARGSGQVTTPSADEDFPYFKWTTQRQPNLPVTSTADWRKPRIVSQVLEVRAAHALDVLFRLLQRTKFNDALLEVDKLSNAHSWMVMYRSFVVGIEDVRDQLSRDTVKALELLRDLFGVYCVESALADLPSYLSTAQHELLMQTHHELLGAIRPYAVPLTDAYDFTDRELTSALGRYDGNVYATLAAWLDNEPLNRHKVNPNIHLLSSVRGKAPAKL
ncbi:hypothetical protein RI367_002084 [Sorochytrium milnesiophthora]